MLPSTLTRWDLQVAEEYKLRPETLFIAVNYIDRFLAKSPVQRGKLQLVGITAMLIAAYARILALLHIRYFSGALTHVADSLPSFSQEVRGDLRSCSR